MIERAQATSSALLARRDVRPHACTMFTVSESDAATIRAAFDQGGELSAAVELRRLFPGIADNAHARECARIIAGWKPLQGNDAPARSRNRSDRRT